MSSVNRNSKWVVRQKKKYIKNWDWSPLEVGAGVETFTFFKRFWKMKSLHISST